MKPGERFTADAKIRALENYAVYGQKLRAAKAAGVNPITIKRHLAKDPEFQAQWDLAHEAFVETIVEEARDLAVNGKSTSLLMFLLRAHAPKIYGEKKHIETKTTVAHEHMLTLDVSKLDPSQMEAVRKLLGPPSTEEPPDPEEPDVPLS